MKIQEHLNWVACDDCKSWGKKRRLIKRQSATESKPNYHLENCSTCSGKGILPALHPTPSNPTKFPHVAIIGGGIGGVALAVACLHRGIPFTLYERDLSFDARSQGYGLTLQQASKAMAGLGIRKLDAGVVSTKHVVHHPDGKVVGEWGMRKWMEVNPNAAPRKNNIHNIHIARQELRLALLKQLIPHQNVKWGYQLTHLKTSANKPVELSFLVNEKLQLETADLVVGADGIRSAVRSLMIDEAIAPMTYLDCIVILGICPLSALSSVQSPLLDSATVFQTANGHERIYIMPYDAKSVMWQLSFPMSEEEAKALSAKGAQALKEEAIRRINWHEPIPSILTATPAQLISGYPVYDRPLFQADWMKHAGPITLIGDAAHPMSPFKGQGANQALLDALALARMIYTSSESDIKSHLRERVLTPFEEEMMTRSAVKVKESRAAAKFLHTDIVLKEGNITRGGFAKQEANEEV